MTRSAAAAAVAMGGFSLAAYGTAARSAQFFGPSVYRGPGRRRSIALTFDDGPSEGSLPLLDYLNHHGISVTFFQCGMNVIRHPRIAQLVRKAGHEIGNHTFSHPRLCPGLRQKPPVKSPEFIYSEFARTQQIIESEVGIVPNLLRAPYGLRWFGMRSMQARLHLLGVMWTVIGHDWEWPANRVSARVLGRASPGGIICLHDGRDVQPTPDTSEMFAAVRTIVPVLKDQGYSFETVGQLLRPDPGTAAAA